jgi:hypothetical protein
MKLKMCDSEWKQNVTRRLKHTLNILFTNHKFSKIMYLDEINNMWKFTFKIERDVRVDNLFSIIEAIRLQNQIKLFTLEKCKKTSAAFLILSFSETQMVFISRKLDNIWTSVNTLSKTSGNDKKIYFIYNSSHS